MAVINLTWIPGGGSSTGQRILRIAKVNGSVPSLTTTFTPANDLPAAQSVATAETLNTNTIYRFKVQSLCPTGGPVDNSNGVQEDLVFACLPNDDVDITPTSQGLTSTASISMTLTNPTPVDGGATILNHTDLTSAELSVYDQANVVQIKPPVTVIHSNRIVSHQFPNLAPNTSYTLRYVLLTTINGILVRSDSTSYLLAACTKAFSTTIV